jgi:hypothetical protein
MKKQLILILLILSANVYSQKGFYLRPLVDVKKWYTNRDQSFAVTTPQGYTLHVKSNNIFSEAGASFGICLGYRTQRYFFEAGISQGTTGIGANVYGLSYDSIVKIYIEEPLYIVTGKFNLVKIPVKMGIKLFGGDSLTVGRKLRWQGFLYAGVDFLFQTHSWTDEVDGKTFISDAQGHEVNYNYVVPDDNQKRQTILGNAGFMIKAYTKKRRNLFNVSLDFSQSLLLHNYFEVNKIVITNYDGTTYSHPLTSRGSSITLTISKDIYFKKTYKH